MLTEKETKKKKETGTKYETGKQMRIKPDNKNIWKET